MRLLIMLMSLTLAGCASAPSTHEKPVPLNQVYQPGLIVEHDGYVAVKFVRDANNKIGFCPNYVYIDNIRAFDLHPNETITVYLEPGNQFFRLSTGTGWCGGGEMSLDTLLEYGKPQEYRALITLSGTYSLMRIR